MKPIGRLNILVFSKMATERVLGGVALRRAKSAVGAEVVEQVHELGELPAALHVRSGRCWDVYEARDHWAGVDLAHAPSDLSAWWRCCCKVLQVSYMRSYRDLDVPRVCQASPRGVATKAQDKLNGRLIKREISQPEYEILWNQINSARRVGKIYT